MSGSLELPETNGADRTFGGVPNEMKQIRQKGLPWILAAFTAVILLLLVVLFVFFFVGSGGSASAASESKKHLEWPKPSTRSLLARFSRAAVVSDNGLCSEVGRSVLLKGGNAADGAIATAVCIGGLHTHSSGLGGGFLMTHYDRRLGKCATLDARETAPLATNLNSFSENPREAFVGPKSIATPGELHGYWTAFKRFGSGAIAWQDLLMPTVNLLADGYPVTKLMETNLQKRKTEILETPLMRSLFVNNGTGELYKEGEIFRNPVLSDTYRRLAISSDPVRLFYGGEIAQTIAFEINSAQNGFLTKKDLETYRTIVDQNPLQNDLFHSDLIVCGPKPSSSFAVIQLILSIVSRLFFYKQNLFLDYYAKNSNPETILKDSEFYHRFVEAQKFAFAQRTLLADPKFVKEAEILAINMTKPQFLQTIISQIKDKTLEAGDYGADFGQNDDKGTSHVSVVDAKGNAVSLTSSVNNIFGSLVRSERLGIIWNDQMDDFSLPGTKNYFGFEPSRVNYIEPGKRPLSSMSPLIIFDKNTKEAKAVVGAAGGSKIISAVAQVILNVLNFNQTVKEAVDMPRIHNQFTPLRTDVEKGFPELMISELTSRGHNVTEMGYPLATVQAVFRGDDNALWANTDHRRPVYMYPTGY